MAVATISEVKVNKLEKAVVNTGAEIEFKMPHADEFVIVFAQAGGSGDLKVKAPTKGSYAAASSDITLAVASGDIVPIRIESARYADTDGTVKITGPASTKFVVCK